METLNHWRWHRSVVAFRYKWSRICDVVEIMPGSELQNCGWWWYARLYRPAADDKGTRAL